ncbi:MAG: hypothetical protein V3S64_09595 [bacterium]
MSDGGTHHTIDSLIAETLRKKEMELERKINFSGRALARSSSRLSYWKQRLSGCC